MATSPVSNASTDDLRAQFEGIRKMLSSDPDQRVYDLEQMTLIARELQMREKAPPPKPSTLSVEALAEIVGVIQEHLWLDLDDDGNDAWNRDKQWSVGLIEGIADALIRHGLRPEGRL